MRPLLLMVMLFVGPLQAQILYACVQIEKTSGHVMHSTSDVTKHETNLCDTHQSCVNIDCDSMFDSNQGSCCEDSAELTINPDLQENIPVINLTEVESDIDPPQVIVTAFSLALPPQILATFVVFSPIYPRQHGSNTYFITQRLRI